MRELSNVLFFLALLSTICFSQSKWPTEGTVTSNIQFKDLDGNNYDLFELLDQDKLVVLHMTFNTWSGCGPAVAENNEAWKYFGKNTGAVLSFKNNIVLRDSKSSFISWMNNWNAELPGISSDEGGFDFRNAIYGEENTGYGGLDYIIKPDKTFVLSFNIHTNNLIADIEAIISQVGITKHPLKNSEYIKIHTVKQSTLLVSGVKNDEYTISFFNANGRITGELKNTRLNIGDNLIDFSNLNLAKGLYLIRIKSHYANYHNTLIIQ